MGLWRTLATYLEETSGGERALALGSILARFLPEPQECLLFHVLTYLKSNGDFAGVLGLDGEPHATARCSTAVPTF